MHTGPVGRWPGVIMARCCMPRRGAAAGVLLILCSVLRLRPLVGIQLQLSFDCGVVRIHRHGMGEAPSKAPRLVRAAEFRSRGGDDSLGPPATCPRFGQMEVGLNGAAARGRRSRSKCTVMRLPSKHERQPRRSAIVLEAPDRDRPRSGPHCTESDRVRCGRCPTQRHPTGGKSGVNL